MNAVVLLNVGCACTQSEQYVDPSVQCKYVCSHIALDGLLAEGQPLDAAPLFAVNSLGGLNWTKEPLFKVSLCLSGYASDFNQTLLSKGCRSHSSLFVIWAPNSRCDAWSVKLDVYVSVGPPAWPPVRVRVAVHARLNKYMCQQFAGCECTMCGKKLRYLLVFVAAEFVFCTMCIKLNDLGLNAVWG